MTLPPPCQGGGKGEGPIRSFPPPGFEPAGVGGSFRQPPSVASRQLPLAGGACSGGYSWRGMQAPARVAALRFSAYKLPPPFARKGSGVGFVKAPSSPSGSLSLVGRLRGRAQAPGYRGMDTVACGVQRTTHFIFSAMRQWWSPARMSCIPGNVPVALRPERTPVFSGSFCRGRVGIR